MSASTESQTSYMLRWSILSFGLILVIVSAMDYFVGWSAIPLKLSAIGFVLIVVGTVIPKGTMETMELED
jgi:hypothetical protein